ncbi:MAG: YggT family protein [Anaerolineales bacterium]|nr:YggT family protein [Anaerolineales bacterium]MCB9145735.1 YggT family protein [Anaerolineales bacterium]
MSSNAVISLFVLLLEFFTWVVVANSILSFFLPPFHPVREALERIVGPFLNPIRSTMPSAGGLDFSPLILILLIQFVSILLRSL